MPRLMTHSLTALLMGCALLLFLNSSPVFAQESNATEEDVESSSVPTKTDEEKVFIRNVTCEADIYASRALCAFPRLMKEVEQERHVAGDNIKGDVENKAQKAHDAAEALRGAISLAKDTLNDPEGKLVKVADNLEEISKEDLGLVQTMVDEANKASEEVGELYKEASKRTPGEGKCSGESGIKSFYGCGDLKGIRFSNYSDGCGPLGMDNLLGHVGPLACKKTPNCHGALRNGLLLTLYVREWDYTRPLVKDECTDKDEWLKDIEDVGRAMKDLGNKINDFNATLSKIDKYIDVVVKITEMVKDGKSYEDILKAVEGMKSASDGSSSMLKTGSEEDPFNISELMNGRETFWGKYSIWIMAGAGSAVGLLLLVTLLFVCCRRRASRKGDGDATTGAAPTGKGTYADPYNPDG
ncbi:unnamed protein product [Trypanosoma congolense IL3000]|uniref:WGS project CAEQ00000000 data, annotated contig 1578 n=1 Tax=Trypanosoma congolense (strain IL3000) TaxID=1068625 RepID=F9W782_TRYCI|nr:unnamed protein product [Trypanosoma congolense IL3000]